MSVPFAAGPLAALIGETRSIVARLDKKYFFKRGPIDYTSWPYDRHPWVMSMQIDESGMFKDINNAVLTFELSTRLADAPGDEETQSIDDGIQDEMRGHLYYLITEMRSLVAQSGDPLVIGMTHTQPITEFHDTGLRVQGISYTFNIGY